MFNSVKEGYLDTSLSLSDPGNISHARWLTTANRFLRLYVATETPSEALIRIVHYIMKCYVPTWFNIKVEESIFKGSIHLFNLIQRCRELDSETQSIVQPVIKNNSYFAHPECILLSMLTDPSANIRKLAHARIRKARGSTTAVKKRKYQLPIVNFQASTYVDMISWKSKYDQDENGFETGNYVTEYTDPPLLAEYSMDEIEAMIEDVSVPKELYSLPCHNQKVERAIKLVSETSKKVTTRVRRDGMIRNVLLSRDEMPRFETKKISV